jgi:hypothetical protein
MSAETISHSTLRMASALGGNASAVEVPEVEPPRSGIAGATDGPMTSPLGDAGEPKRPFAGMKRNPGEGKIIHTSEGWVFPLSYDQAAVSRVQQRTPWLLAELLAELERNRR